MNTRERTDRRLGLRYRWAPLSCAPCASSCLTKRFFISGDTARVPYGGKSAATVERYSLEITEMLLAEDCKNDRRCLQNTASALALPRLESTTPIPVTGVIRPGAQAAVAATRNGHIGVIGTRATIKSGAYERALRTFDPTARITARACPLFVP